MGPPGKLPALLPASAALLLAWAAPAFAAGGAHVIDDAEVEAAGHCHVETWITRYTASARLINLSPACTRREMPRLEIGAAFQHLDLGRTSGFSVGPTLKYELRAPDHRLGIAVSAAAGWSNRTDRVETAGIIVPLTLDLPDTLRINANTGWTWLRSGDVNSGFVGGQLDAAVSKTVSLMVEVFDRQPGRAGAQTGVRWTPREWLDLDLLAGRYVDGVSRSEVTVGVTVRH